MQYFPTPDSLKKLQQPSPYQSIINWFKKGNKADLMINLSDKEYKKLIHNIPNLEEVVKKFHPNLNGNSRLLLMEFLLFGLSEYSLLSRTKIEDGIQFRDMLSSMFSMPQNEDFEEDDDESQYKF